MQLDAALKGKNATVQVNLLNMEASKRQKAGMSLNLHTTLFFLNIYNHRATVV
jgi:hypothetical protein